MSAPAAESSPADSAPRSTALSRNVKVLGWTSLVNDVASESIFPLMPTFLKSVLGASATELGVIEGLADATASLLKLASGASSDALGKRKIWVVLGYALTTLVRPLVGFARTPWHVLAVRLSDRTGKGIRTSARDAMVADSTPTELRGRAFAFHRAMDHLGAAIGPLLSATFLWFYPGALRTLFLLTAIPGALVVLLVIFGLQETPSPPHPSGERARLQLSPRPLGARFGVYLAALALFTLGNSSDAFLLLQAQDLGVPVVWIPVLWCAFHALKSAGSIWAGPRIDRHGGRPMVWLGWFIFAAVYVGFALASQAWHVWALFGCYAGFYALAEPAEKVLVASLCPPQARGLCFGYFHFVVGVATLPASILFGELHDRFGPPAAFGTSACLALAACAVLALVPAAPPTARTAAA